jgi:serine/threonine protein kinase
VKELVDTVEFRDQRTFLREVAIPASLPLPGIVRILGFCLPEDQGPGNDPLPGLIVTEYMPNGNLQDLIDQRLRGQLNPLYGPTQMSKVIFGTAYTMARLHERNIIHRDLKPGNIFMDDRWEPRVADFGLSRAESEKGDLRMTMAIGSPLFMAPELYADTEVGGGQPYNETVDVFSFAILVYQMFTNAVELDDGQPYRSADALMMRISRGNRYKKAEEIPDPIWDNVITRCWAQKPAERPSFAAVADLLLNDDGIIVPGTNLEEYREYRARLIAETEKGIDEQSKLTASGYGARKAPPPQSAPLRKPARFQFTRKEGKT